MYQGLPTHPLYQSRTVAASLHMRGTQKHAIRPPVSVVTFPQGVFFPQGFFSSAPIELLTSETSTETPKQRSQRYKCELRACRCKLVPLFRRTHCARLVGFITGQHHGLASVCMFVQHCWLRTFPRVHPTMEVLDDHRADGCPPRSPRPQRRPRRTKRTSLTCLQKCVSANSGRQLT
jgi:hypothetical protein